MLCDFLKHWGFAASWINTRSTVSSFPLLFFPLFSLCFLKRPPTPSPLSFLASSLLSTHLFSVFSVTSVLSFVSFLLFPTLWNISTHSRLPNHPQFTSLHNEDAGRSQCWVQTLKAAIKRFMIQVWRRGESENVVFDAAFRRVFSSDLKYFYDNFDTKTFILFHTQHLVRASLDFLSVKPQNCVKNQDRHINTRLLYR